jgi:hypothetical protein
VQFGLQFEEVTEGEAPQTPANAQDPSQGSAQDKPGKRKRVPSIPQAVPAPETSPPATAAPPSKTEPEQEPEPDKPSRGGGEVVRLDRFRKK